MYRPIPHPPIYRFAFCVTLLGVLAACEGANPSYFPLDDGRYWQYQIEKTTMDGAVTQKYLLQTIAVQTINDLRVSGQRTVDGNIYFYQTDANGVRRIGHQVDGGAEIEAQDPALIVLPNDPKIGSQWTQLTHTKVLENSGPPWETLFRIIEPVQMDYKISSTNDTINVPAGEFRGCLKVSGFGSVNVDVGNYIGRMQISVEITQWYAPSVGLVRSHRVESTDASALTGGSLMMELESYSP